MLQILPSTQTEQNLGHFKTSYKPLWKLLVDKDKLK